MANQNLDEMSERELDALTWQTFFLRPGERPMDAEGYWSQRLGVRLAYPRYANDPGAAARIEIEVLRRGLRSVYVQVLLELVGPQAWLPADPATIDETLLQEIPATPDQRRRAALKAVNAQPD
jgi:hypothetical protein